jgi:hypothetical protein
MIKIKSGLPFSDEVMLLAMHALVKNEPPATILTPSQSEKPDTHRLSSWKELKENFEELLKSAQMSDPEKERARQIIPQVIKTAESKQYVQCFSKSFGDQLTLTPFNEVDSDQLYFFVTLPGRQALYEIFKKLAGKFIFMIIGGLTALVIIGIVISKLLTRI